MDDPAHDLHPSRCTSCGSRLVHDQRYCLTCGLRRGPLPANVESHLAALAGAGVSPLIGQAADEAVDDAEAPDGDAEAGLEGASAGLFDGLIAGRWLLTPRIASLAVMSVLSFGVIAGSLTTPGGAAGLAHTLIVAVAPSPQSTPAGVGSGAADGGSVGGGGSSGGNPTPAAPVTITETVGSPATPAGSGPVAQAPAGSGAGGGSGTGNSLNQLPPIKHVWEIMLSDQGYNSAFGQAKGHPYLARTLPKQGELITNYYSVAPSSLANAIAMVSGQGPTNQTAANCPNYTPLTPGTLGPEGQATGDGCVYPALAQTLPDELAQNGNTWRGYIQSVDSGPPAPAGQPATATTCRHPAVGSTDPNHAPSAQDPYVTWRNPFVYFQSLLNSSCDKLDVGLSHLATDLKKVSTTPNFSYIAPDPCHDGSDTPCQTGAPAGLATTDAFLKSVVPEIEASPAYKQDGLIVITFDQAPQSGAAADSSSCCDQPTFPNMGSSGSAGPASSSTTSASTTSPTTSTTTGTPSETLSVPTPLTTTTVATPLTATTTDTTSGSPSSPTTNTSNSTTAPCPSTTTSTTPTSPSSGSSTTSSTPTSTSTGSGTTGTSPSTGACPGTGTGTPPGGGQVGALLLSRYVKAGSLDSVSDLNHFSLLKTVEDLFGVAHLGYTQDPSLPEFDSAVFNAGS